MRHKTIRNVFLVTVPLISTFLSSCSFIAISGQTGNPRTAVASSKSVDSLKDAKTLSDEAYALIGSGDYQAAILKAKLAVEKDPNLGEGQKNLALAYCDSGRVNEALAPAENAVKSAPQLDRAHFVLAKVLFKLGRLEESKSRIQEAIRVNPRYDKAYFVLGLIYDRLNNPKAAEEAFDQADKLKPDNPYYAFYRDSLVAYVDQLKKPGTLPTIKPIEGKPTQYATLVYSGIFFEALLHHNFDLIDRAADAARSSKEKLPGGYWKLQHIYLLLGTPIDKTSDRDWDERLELLKNWTQEKPASPTAKMALASCYVAFAWNARGEGFANTVSEQNWQLFAERLRKAKAVLESDGGKPACPKWYSLMQQVALGQNWDPQTYEQLFEDSIAFEPTWYEYYKRKAIFLLPQWHGKPGELEDYVESFSTGSPDKERDLIYFLVKEYADALGSEGSVPLGSYARLKEGFMSLRKRYGVTNDDMNYAHAIALRSHDQGFAQELFVELKSNVSGRVTMEEFETLRKAFEQKQ